MAHRCKRRLERLASPARVDPLSGILIAVDARGTLSRTARRVSEAAGQRTRLKRRAPLSLHPNQLALPCLFSTLSAGTLHTHHLCYPRIGTASFFGCFPAHPWLPPPRRRTTCTNPPARHPFLHHARPSAIAQKRPREKHLCWACVEHLHQVMILVGQPRTLDSAVHPSGLTLSRGHPSSTRRSGAEHIGPKACPPLTTCLLSCCT